jgi:hypothetical protein
MRNFVLAVAALASLSGAAYASPSPAPPDDVAQTDAMKAFTDLKAEYEKAFKDFVAAYQASKTDEDRKKSAAARPNPADWSPKFKALAQKHESDPVAAECLAWIVQNDRTPATQQEALDALLSKHLASPAMGRVCQTLEYSQAPGAEGFLRAVVEKSKEHEAQGRACYSLARVVSTRSALAARVQSGEQFPAEMDQWYGAGWKEKLEKADLAALQKEAESLFERVAADFDDLKWYDDRSLGAKAKGDLYEMRNLTVGKTAPEIVGEDENGKAIKLSDFRGKVVLLDFWGFW